MSSQQQLPSAEILEEDDEFEEFEDGEDTQYYCIIFLY